MGAGSGDGKTGPMSTDRAMSRVSRRTFLQHSLMAVAGLELGLTAVRGAAVEPSATAAGITLDELLQANPGAFVLLSFDGARVREQPLSVFARDGARVTVEISGQALPRFTLRVDESPSYFALHLEQAQGDFGARDTSLAFRGPPAVRFEAFCLDYMGRNDSDARRLQLTWPYLWNPNPADPLGAFAIVRSGLSDEARDGALADIWAEGTLPHPEIGEPWTRAAVERWVDMYHEKFARLSETTLSAANPAELYQLSEWLADTGCRRVYLHTDTWRAEYWPRKRSFVALNPAVFPGGRDDLKAYRRFLNQRGVLLRLHNVSAGIGLQDPEFVLGDRVDSRLATWVQGRLEEAVTGDATEIRFRPNPDSSFPHIRLETHWNLKRFRIGAEVLEVGEIHDADQPVWRLRSVKRGFGGTPASLHLASTPAAGLLCTYGQNYVPDNQSSLLPEMAVRYATLINEAELDHQHYDGAEIHMHLEPWGFDKLSSLVASRVGRATTTSTSGGRPTKWNFELNFSRIRRLRELGYWGAAIPVLLDGHRNASSLLDAHFEIGSRLLRPARRLGFFKPEPMFGVTFAALQGHGLMPEYVELFRHWTKAIGGIGERETAWLREHLKPVQSKLRQRGHHEQGWDVPVLVKGADGFALVPTRVLVREGMDAPWLTGQEFGPVGPRQYVLPGEAIRLHNPHPAQPPGLILHVLPALRRSSAGGAAAVAVARQDDTLADYQTGTVSHPALPTVSSAPATTLWSAKSSVTAAGDTRLVVDAGAIELSAENPSGEAIWEEQQLPSWACAVPLGGRRGLHLDIVGDGSGAVLVCQLHGRGVRDYVVKIDFKGPRQFTIPNGEAAWTAACWGWRFDAHHFDYDAAVTRVNVGFGYIPARCRAKVVVRRLELMDNVVAPLRDAAVHVGSGVLRTRGEVLPGEYLTYSAETGVQVTDANWKFLRTLDFAVERWVASSGPVEVRVEAASAPDQPWLELQVTTRGEPFPIHGAPL